MNSITKNAMALSCFVEGFCKTLTGDESATVKSMIRKLRVANNNAMENLPSPTEKEVAQIARRIARVDQYVVATTQPYRVLILSFLLGLIEESRLTGKRREAFDGVHQRVRQVHRHFDRNTNKNMAYREASVLITKWRSC